VSLRRSVQIGATSVATAGLWCQNMLESDELCAYDDPAAAVESDTIGEGVHPGALASEDATRSDGASVDRYDITLTEGQRVEIWVTSEAFDTYAVLRSPNGRVVAINDDAGSMESGTDAQIVYYPRHSGVFQVEAGAARAEQLGAYELIVNFGEPEPSRTPRRPRPTRPQPAAMPEPWQQPEERPFGNDDRRGARDERGSDWEQERRGRNRGRGRRNEERWDEL